MYILHRTEVPRESIYFVLIIYHLFADSWKWHIFFASEEMQLPSIDRQRLHILDFQVNACHFVKEPCFFVQCVHFMPEMGEYMTVRSSTASLHL